VNERTVFLAALERDDPAQRAAYLDATCAGDPGLRRRVEALLQAHTAARASQFLNEPAVEQLAAATPPACPAPQAADAPSGTDDGARLAGEAGDVTQEEQPAEDGDAALAFLEPSQRPD
jgi:hypothetical protein